MQVREAANNISRGLLNPVAFGREDLTPNSIHTPVCLSVCVCVSVCVSPVFCVPQICIQTKIQKKRF